MKLTCTIKHITVFLLGPENFRLFPNFSTFYGAKYFTSLYSSVLNCPEDNKIFKPFYKNVSQWLMV